MVSTLKHHSPEYEGRNVPYDQHYPSPESWNVYNLFMFTDGFIDFISCLFWTDHKESLFRTCQQISFYKARFHGKNVHTMAGQAVAQGFQVAAQSCLGGVVGWISHPAPISCHRRDPNNLPGS